VGEKRNEEAGHSGVVGGRWGQKGKKDKDTLVRVPMERKTKMAAIPSLKN